MVTRVSNNRHGGPARWATAIALAVLSACAPVQQAALTPDIPPEPAFSDNWFTSFDGARLGLNVYPARNDAEGAGPCDNGAGLNITTIAPACAAMAGIYTTEPDVVIVAVHGMNDYAGAFNGAGAWWSAHGATVYAYDQRGFGRSPGWMLWPRPDVMRKDLDAAVEAAHRAHPRARVAVVGESMGAAVAITTFAEPGAPKIDALILSGPGLWGWSALPWFYSASLWVTSHVRPDWIVVPPEGVHVVATDNNRKLREMWYDPLVQKKNRIDSVYGVVSIMDEADRKIADLPDSIPTLLLRGAKDEVIPEDSVKHATLRMSPHVRTAWYARGYHMLMNDLQAETVWSDILAFVRQPESPLPSRSPPLPWLARKAEKP